MTTPHNLNTLLGINVSPKNVEEDEPCRECGEDASEDDRPMKDDALCWDCYRDIYGEEVGSILIERLFPTGALRISRNGDARTYYGHSQRDALTLFRREFGE